MTNSTTSPAPYEGQEFVLALPADIPLPRYQWGQQVYLCNRPRRTYLGIIRGLEYFTPSLSQAFDHTLDWVGWNYTLEMATPQGLSITTVAEREIQPCNA